MRQQESEDTLAHEAGQRVNSHARRGSDNAVKTATTRKHAMSIQEREQNVDIQLQVLRKPQYSEGKVGACSPPGGRRSMRPLVVYPQSGEVSRPHTQRHQSRCQRSTTLRGRRVYYQSVPPRHSPGMRVMGS